MFSLSCKYSNEGLTCTYTSMGTYVHTYVCAPVCVVLLSLVNSVSCFVTCVGKDKTSVTCVARNMTGSPAQRHLMWPSIGDTSADGAAVVQSILLHLTDLREQKMQNESYYRIIFSQQLLKCNVSSIFSIINSMSH